MKKLILVLLLSIGCKGNIPAQERLQDATQQIVTLNVAPSNSNNDSLLLLTLIGIIGNFGKIFVDPHNIPQVQQSVINIIDGIVTAANLVVTNRGPAQKLPCFLPLMLVQALHYKAYALEQRT